MMNLRFRDSLFLLLNIKSIIHRFSKKGKSDFEFLVESMIESTFSDFESSSTTRDDVSLSSRGICRSRLNGIHCFPFRTSGIESGALKERRGCIVTPISRNGRRTADRFAR